MPSELETTWETRELPILVAIGQAEEAGGNINAAAQGALSDLADQVYVKTIDRLRDAGYITTFGVEEYPMPAGLTERGLRAVGTWPSEDVFRELVKVIEANIDTAPTPQERKKLEGLRDALVAVGTATGTQVLSTLVLRTVGIG